MKNKGTLRKVLRLVEMLQPGFLALITITKILASGQPFVMIFFGSVILDMLVERAALREIMTVIVWMAGLSALLVLLRWGLEMAVVVKKRMISQKVDEMMCEKSCEMDYELLMGGETLDMRQRAWDGVHNNGDLGDFCELLASAIENICTIIYSGVLLFSLLVPGTAAGQRGLAGLLDKWYSGVFLLAVMALSLWMNSIANHRSARIQQDSFEENVRNNRHMEYFWNVAFDYSQGKNIRIYKMTDMILGAIKKNNEAMERISQKTIRRIQKVKWINSASALLLQFCSYLYVGLKAIYGLVSIGSTMRYISAYQNLSQSVGSIFDMFIQLGVKSRYLVYFYNYMEIPNQRYEGTIPIEKRDDNRYEIEFRDVSFRYPDSDKIVLSHVSEKFTMGSKMAVVGPNGSGKSTFIKLLCRLYEPTEGEILLNGVNIQYYDFQEYIRLFSVVFQDFHLFAFSIGENVATSCEYEEKKVKECIDKAGFAIRLQDMPEGIRTNIYQMEEKGVEISGGEAQKLAIARALYKDAPWVILDEPTAALDPIAEYEIYSHFNEMVRDKTSIYISHRMSSCRFCDTIYVFEDGRIIQKGSHETLIKEENGLYSRLWNAQAQYYKTS